MVRLEGHLHPDRAQRVDGGMEKLVLTEMPDMKPGCDSLEKSSPVATLKRPGKGEALGQQWLDIGVGKIPGMTRPVPYN